MDDQASNLLKDERDVKRLRFSSPELERKFLEFYIQQNIGRVRVVVAIFMFLMGAGLLSRPQSAIGTNAGNKMAVVYVCYIAVFVAALSKRTRHWVAPMFGLFTVIIEIIMGMGMDKSQVAYAVLINVMYGTIVVAALQSRFWLSMGFAVSMVSAWCVSYYMSQMTFKDFGVPLFTGVLAMTFLCVSSYLNETRDRRVFLLQRSLEAEKQRTQDLVRNVLPPSIADRLAQESGVIAQHHDAATILFCDIIGFTPFAASKPPETVVGLLNDLFSRFDALLPKFHVVKIKTIGDCYMVAGGIPDFRDDHVAQIADLALEMRGTANAVGVDVRIGVHSGPVIAGVLGTERLMYDIWGPTVNLASRLESSSDAGMVTVSNEVHDFLASSHEFSGPDEVDLKGIGKLPVWRLVRRQPRPLEFR